MIGLSGLDERKRAEKILADPEDRALLWPPGL